MTLAYVGLGSNLGDRAQNIKTALERLDQTPGIKILRQSSLYETDPVGDPDQGRFLNGVAEVETTLSPDALLTSCLKTERELGRVRNPQNRFGPRTVDLDILFYGHEVLSLQGLEIPHPRLHERAFVLIPLMDLAPELIHPQRGQSIRQLSAALSSPDAVSFRPEASPKTSSA